MRRMPPKIQFFIYPVSNVLRLDFEKDVENFRLYFVHLPGFYNYQALAEVIEWVAFIHCFF